MGPIVSLEHEASDLEIGQGFNLYMSYCVSCHGFPGGGGSVVPDLTRSQPAMFSIYDDIVLRGAFESQGMPNFGDLLVSSDVAKIKSYVLYTAQAFNAGVGPDEYFADLAAKQNLADQHE